MKFVNCILDYGYFGLDLSYQDEFASFLPWDTTTMWTTILSKTHTLTVHFVFFFSLSLYTVCELQKQKKNHSYHSPNWFLCVMLMPSFIYLFRSAFCLFTSGSGCHFIFVHLSDTCFVFFIFITVIYNAALFRIEIRSRSNVIPCSSLQFLYMYLIFKWCMCVLDTLLRMHELFAKIEMLISISSWMFSFFYFSPFIVNCPEIYRSFSFVFIGYLFHFSTTVFFLFLWLSC